jgi:L-ribulose-5-phosphate 3-epimerase
MFKLAVISDEISQDLAVAAAMVREFGGEGLEIRSVWEKSPPEFDAEERRRIARIAAAYGLRICGVASPCYKCPLGEPAEEAQHLEMLRRCIALAHALDTNLIRVFTFWRQPGPPPWERIADRFRAPIRLAEQEDVILGIENEGSTMAANAGKVAELLTIVDHPRLRAIWDPGNEAAETEAGGAFPAGYEILKPWIAHVQLKDIKRHPDGTVESVQFGTGDIDYIGQLKALKRDGYQGYLSLETHWRLRHEIPQDLVRQPKGSAFSHGGEEATRRCLAKLREMLQQIEPTL